MYDTDTLGTEVKHLIIETLMLEDVSVADIDSDAPLFNEGLGLDSIDALDFAMALEERYGLRANQGAAKNGQHFASVRSVAEFVAANRTK
jgi:acyl carrier protein